MGSICTTRAQVDMEQPDEQPEPRHQRDLHVLADKAQRFEFATDEGSGGVHYH